MLNISIMMMFFLVWTFYRNYYYILNLLIILEALMLSVILFSYNFNTTLYTSNFMFLLLLTFAACEAALGLSLLVSFLRVRSSNFLSSMGSTNW
nr:NADH dehydrogenase subunit 4L [Lymnaea stagnalis]